MNEPMPLIDLVINAGLVVQFVMGLLVLASLVSWWMIFQRGFSLRITRRDAIEFEDEFWSGRDLASLYQEVEEMGESIVGMEHIFVAGFKEFTRMQKQESMDQKTIMQNVARSMRVALSREEERLETHLPFLATVGSISPYVGLFGTVWGIMNSFRGLATVNQASLSIVAPGISEALIATAMGLFAAIPAVVAYNRYSAQVDVIMNRFDAFTDEFSGILQRAISTNRS